MDREQEDLQFLGLFGIYRESFKIITKCWKIFSQITLALILPLSFLFLAHVEISNLIFRRWRNTAYLAYEIYPGTGTYHLLFDHMTRQRAYYWLFRLANYIVILIFSLLSTSAVVYTIACVYTSRDITFKKIMSVVPKVWKRLMVTFLCAFLSFFIYNVVLVLIILLFIVTIGESDAFVPIFYIILILYLVGFIYMTVVWQLASVVSVLENIYGFKAFMKSKNLIKGKLWIAIFIFFKLNFSLVCLQFVFEIWVVCGYMSETWKEVLIGMSCLVGLFTLVLLGLTIQTIIYFVCKSYHHENIDKSALSDHLEVIYLGEYVPLKGKDIQLEQSRV